jgi:CheY-like chemotaxis protein
LDRLSATSGHFALVLLDLNMPGMDGEQTFHAIRRVHPELPIVICSGYSDREVQSRFRDTTVSGFVQKPFNSRTLSDKVSDLLRPA